MRTAGAVRSAALAFAQQLAHVECGLLRLTKLLLLERRSQAQRFALHPKRRDRREQRRSDATSGREQPQADGHTDLDLDVEIRTVEIDHRRAGGDQRELDQHQLRQHPAAVPDPGRRDREEQRGQRTQPERHQLRDVDDLQRM